MHMAALMEILYVTISTGCPCVFAVSPPTSDK
jgi:hypothetical protein